MKHLLFILFITLCASASAQTIRTLGYNSTNGQIVAATNVVWTNSFSFSTNTVAEQVRTNLSAAAATNWAGDVGPGAANRALTLVGNDGGTAVLAYDELGGDGWVMTDASSFQSVLFSATNSAPTNTASVAGWVNLKVGTNNFKLPVYK